MSNLKLAIELIPKGAWGNNLRERLSAKDWDTLRNICYEKAKHRCAICGKDDVDLEAHEVWDFEIGTKTQTLKDIIALCPACHGVKHFRNSTRIGYGDHAKAHFLKVNKCSPLQFASHYAEAEFMFEERNEILRWKLKADLSKFGGKGIEIKERIIPFIQNPYEAIDWDNVNQIKGTEREKQYIVMLINDDEKVNKKNEKAAGYLTTKNAYDNLVVSFRQCPLQPKICSIEVNNYEGSIVVKSNYANKIEWLSYNQIIEIEYNFGGIFSAKFIVDDLKNSSISFRLIGDFGKTSSQEFKLFNIA